METEAQAYVRLRDELISRMTRRADELEHRPTLTPADEIELTALDLLIIDLYKLEY